MYSKNGWDRHLTSRLAWYSRYRCSRYRSLPVLVNDNCEFELFNMKQDEGGTYIIFDVKIEDIPFLLINIYGPNNDTPIFFSTLISLIEDMYSSQHIF